MHCVKALRLGVSCLCMSVGESSTMSEFYQENEPQPPCVWDECFLALTGSA